MKALALVAILQAPVSAQLPPKDAGPATVIIQYRCPIASRAALRQAAQSDVAAQFEKWLISGRLAGYRLLFSRYVDSNNWDMMAVQVFAMVQRRRGGKKSKPGNRPGCPWRRSRW